MFPAPGSADLPRQDAVGGMLRFRGSQQLRQRLVFATLSGRTIRVDGIRERDESPGLRDYEANLLRLLEKLTDGCVVEINETGEHKEPAP